MDYRSALHSTAMAADNAGLNLSTFEVMNLTDALIARGVNYDPKRNDWSTHNGLVNEALASTAVMDHVRAGMKIRAIKSLRYLTNCGLKPAKEAVEDVRVTVSYPSDHYDSPSYTGGLEY